MEKKKTSNLNIIVSTILICMLIVLGVSIYKYLKNHDAKLIYSTEENVKYFAYRCYLEGECQSITTLGTLYDKGYIEEVVNPVTKEIVSRDKYIFINGSTIVFNLE